MKFKFNIVRTICMLIVAAGLLMLTHSFWMSLGIFILLLIFDIFVGDKLQEWIDRRNQEE